MSMPIWSPIPSLLEGFLIEVLLGVKTAPIGAAGSWASMKRFTWPQSLYSPGVRPGAGAATSSCRDGLAAGFSMDGSAAFTPGGVTARATAGTAAASRGGMAEDGRGGKDLAPKASWPQRRCLAVTTGASARASTSSRLGSTGLRSVLGSWPEGCL